MILLIIKSYLTLLLSVGMGSLIIFIIGLYFICRKSPAAENKQAPENVHDVSAIAGDDVITTQLDLARAYIETGRTQLAKTLLKRVIKQGNDTQQEEAQQLMNRI